MQEECSITWASLHTHHQHNPCLKWFQVLEAGRDLHLYVVHTTSMSVLVRPCVSTNALTMRRLMAVLARDSPLRASLHMASWLDQLLYITADAAATRDWLLASRALDAFSVCLRDSGAGRSGGGEEVATALRLTNVFPLLRQLWEQPDELLRRSVATTVAAMSEPGGWGRKRLTRLVMP